MNKCSHLPDAFDETDETMGVLLATHGALALANASARSQSANLRMALITSREIGMALGILMAMQKVTRARLTC